MVSVVVVWDMGTMEIFLSRAITAIGPRPAGVVCVIFWATWLSSCSGFMVWCPLVLVV